MPTTRASGAKRATRKPRRTAATRRPAVPATPHDPAEGRMWFLAVPFQQQVDGARWDPVRKAHTHVAPALPNHLIPYRSQPYTGCAAGRTRRTATPARRPHRLRR